MVYTVTTTIKPSDIYGKTRREAMQTHLAKYRLRVLGFRTPGPGDLYIGNRFYTAFTIHAFLAFDTCPPGDSGPRIIVALPEVATNATA